MSFSLALATALLLTAEPGGLPPGHPPLQPGTQASPAHPPAQPPAHPSMGAGASTSRPAPSGPLPEGHPPVGATGRAPPSGEELLRQLDATEGLKAREKTFEIASALGKLYFTHGRTADALEYLVQAEQKAEPLRQLFATQRRKLGNKALVSAQEAGCGFTSAMSLEAMGRVAEERAKKGDAPGAVACAREALQPALEVEVLHGHVLYRRGDMDGALRQYGRALEVSAADEEALFARSAILFETKGEDVKALGAAREGFEALLAAHPESNRAPLARQLSRMAEETVKAGGRKAWLRQRAEDRRIRLSEVLAPPGAGPMASAGPLAGTRPPAAAGPDAPAPLTKEMVEAVQNTERTPELEAGLAKLVEEGEEHLARGRHQEALAAYTRVVPFQPENGRAKAGMAWALVGLGRPMADRIWGVAVQSDASAVEALGDTLRAKGDAAGAKALWTKLRDSVPGYPNKASLEAKLAR